MNIMEGPQLCLSLALAAKTFRPPLRAIGQQRTLLLGRVRCLGPFSESLNMEARQVTPLPVFSRTWCSVSRASRFVTTTSGSSFIARAWSSEKQRS